MDTTNVAASSASARPTPSSPPRPPTKAAMSTPASTGPTNCDTWSRPCTPGVGNGELVRARELRHDGALGGEEEAVRHAEGEGHRISIHRRTAPLSTSAASSATSTSRATLEPSMTRRGEKRSVTAPPTSMKAARGTPCTASTIPSTAALPLSCSASQGTAMK